MNDTRPQEQADLQPPMQRFNATTLARTQTGIFACISLVFSGLFIVSQIADAHDELLLRRDIARWKRTGGMYVDERFFITDTDRLLFDVIPFADYSKQGFYFVGSSVTARGMSLWDWPAPDRTRVHNYGVAAANDFEQCQLIKYLIDYQGFRGRTDKKAIVSFELFFGASSQSDTPEFEDGRKMWESSFNHDGLLQYDRGEGIRPVECSRLVRRWRLAELRCQSFWNWVIFPLHLSERVPNIVAGTGGDATAVQIYWTRRLGPHWANAMDIQLDYISRMIDELRSLGFVVTATYMPLASWTDRFEPAVHYRQQAIELMKVKGVEVLDLAHTLDDSDFLDSVHVTQHGQEKIQPALIKMAERYLGPPETTDTNEN